jgi:hypothetical protein
MATGNVEVFAAAIAAGRTVREAAAVASMSARTAQRRLNDPDVVARIEEKRPGLGEAEGDGWRRMREQAMTRLAELVWQ